MVKAISVGHGGGGRGEDESYFQLAKGGGR